MKGFLRKLELPEFVKDTRLTASLIIVLVLSCRFDYCNGNFALVFTST